MIGDIFYAARPDRHESSYNVRVLMYFANLAAVSYIYVYPDDKPTARQVYMIFDPSNLV